jgi:hypothetical protein
MRCEIVVAAIVPNMLSQVLVPVLSNCTALFGCTAGYVVAEAEPFEITVTPVALKTIWVVPRLTIVISVPIGNATDAFVGIVIVCAPVLAE